MTRFAPAGSLRGALRAPPDKSISHRAAILAAMGEGEARIDDYLDAADTRATLEAVRALGARIEAARGEHGFALRIHGVGLRGARGAELDVGNAGTLLRILPGWLAGQPGGEWTLDGDESIRQRPVDRVVEPLREMGAEIGCAAGGLPPLQLRGAELHGMVYRLPVASAQVKSCLLLAGLLAEGATVVVEPAPTRDHTERMLRSAGATIANSEPTGAPATIAHTVEAAHALTLGELRVPGDFSSAASWIVAALLVPGSEVRIQGCGLNHTRTGLLPILERMGAEIEITGVAESAGEPVGDLRARHAALAATTVRGAEIPLAIDELPLVGLAACFAEGETRVLDAAELRHKESDRIGALVAGLRGLGADAEELEDGFAVRGTGGLRGGVLDAEGDHRLAMLAAVAGLASPEGVEVRGMEAAAVSYPGFESDLAALLGQ